MAPELNFPLMCENFQFSRKAIPYAKVLITGVTGHWQSINTLIQQNAQNWRLGRMSVIDRNIMRVAVFEMLYVDDVPVTVAINEAIEIAKTYSTEDAPPFINGILDAIRKTL